MDEISHPTPGYDQGRSHIWTAETIRAIHAKSELGRYQIRGFSTFQKLPTLDDLVFLPGVMTRLPLEGYREHCETKTLIGGGRPDLVSRAARARVPGLPDVDELRRARHEREARARHGLLARGPRDVHGRGRHAARGARGLRQADLPDDAVALRARPRAPAHGRRDRDRRRPGREARHRRDAARHEGQREGRARCARCPSASTSARPRATPTSSAATTSRSRSRSCARRPTTACRSSSSSPPAASSRTSRSPPRPAATRSSWTARRARPPPRRSSSSTTPACRR